MKRTFPLWLGLLAFALLPVLAQNAPKPVAGPTGKIHGHVTSPMGYPKTTGSGSLSMDGGNTLKFTFPISATGDYTGDATPGTYTVVYRDNDTPAGKMIDYFNDVKIIFATDTLQDIDMSRKEFLARLTPDQQKQLEALKKQNAEAMKVNDVIKNINADIRASNQDLKDIDAAHATAIQTLGATATKPDVDAKEAEIKTAKYTEIETLMLKDTAAKPDAAVLWDQLGQAQLGLKKYDDSMTAYKKALELESAAKTPNPQTVGAANAGIGEVNVRTGKTPEAAAAYDTAATANPPLAAFYFTNEASILVNTGNGDAAVAAAEEAIKADPTKPLPYYLKGQGLIQKATIDSATGKMILPPGCAEAYQKYLDLAPTGQFANDVKGILAEATQTHSSAFGTAKPKKGK